MSHNTNPDGSPENVLPQPQEINQNVKHSLKDLLTETIKTMNAMMTQFASLPQMNPNFMSSNDPQNSIPTNHGPEHHGQHLETQIFPNHDQNRSASTPRSEQSPISLEFDPLKSRIDKVEAELTKIRVGGNRSVSFRDLCPFPDVLERSLALKWFTSLDLSDIASFDHLSNLFVDQYSYNLDMEPRREDLESLRQNKDEPFVAYVGRWRAMAARVKPKPTKEESINMIIKSSLSTISGYLAIQGHPDFTALIQSGSRVETAVKQGLMPALGLQSPPPNQFNVKRTRNDQKNNFSSNTTKSQEDVNATFEVSGTKQTVFPQNSFSTDNRFGGLPKPAHTNAKNGPITHMNHTNSQFSATTQSQQTKVFRKFTPIGEPPSSILVRLFQEGAVTLLGRQVNLDSKGYDPIVFCEYHQSAGHHTDKCYNLRHTIQDLIDKGVIAIKEPPTEITNIMANPLPQHRKNDEATCSQTVNSIECGRYDPFFLNGSVNHFEQKLTPRTIKVLGVRPKDQMTPVHSKRPIEVLGVREPILKPMVVMGPKRIEVLGKPIMTNLNHVPFDYNQTPVCAELSNMTRSGRVYKPSYLTTEPVPEDSKTRDNPENQTKKDSSGYDVVSQLKKTKAEISVWELLVKSPTHYQALQKVLQSVNVPTNVVTSRHVNVLVININHYERT
ncbi:uncharacterized protein LOC144574658 [Carex rostrata]